MHRIQATIGDETPSPKTLTAAGAAIRAMHEYGRKTSRLITAQKLELQALARMVTGTIASLAPVPADSVALRDINWKIGKASTLEDIRHLKAQISAFLETTLAPQSKNEADADVANILDQQLQQSTVTTRKERLDGLHPTGISHRLEAEAAIRQAREQGNYSLAIVFVVDRLSHINLCFGRSIGEQIIRLFRERLVNQLPGKQRLFRWGESSILVLLEEHHAETHILERIERVQFERLVETFIINDRPVMLVISASWMLIPVTDADCIAVIDSFIKPRAR